MDDARYLASWCVAEPTAAKIGHNGTPDLWTFGKP